MDNTKLAELITERYMPFAFKCDCQGDHPDCLDTKVNDTWALAQADTVYRIAKYITELKETR
jgi:hypothetical protein